MGEDRFLLVFLCILPCLNLSSGGPLVTSNGSLDNHGVEQHILQLEQTVADLTAQFQAQEHKSAAVISSLLSKFASTSDGFSTLKLDFDKLEAKYNSSLIEISTTNDLLTATKGDLLRANAEIDVLRQKNNATFLGLAAVKRHLDSTEIKFTQNDNLLRTLQENMTLAVSQLLVQKDELKTTSDGLRNVIKKAATTATAQKHLQGLITSTESDVQTVNQKVSGMEKSMRSLSTKLNGITTNEQTIAFSCALNHDKTVNNQEVVKYDHVILNVGNGFHRGTGIFTCPRSGIYIFNVHAFTSPGKVAKLLLLHNGVTVASVSEHGANGYDGDGNSAIVQAKRGDRIWVTSYQNSTLHDLGSHLFNTFSGFLLGH